MKEAFMNRRDFLKTLSCGAAALAVQGCSGTSGFSSRKTRKPNIILIMADDIGYECFGCYGSASYKTPVLDGLAQEGMRFKHCYSQPLCTPSRVKIMTGQYNFRNYTNFGYSRRQAIVRFRCRVFSDTAQNSSLAFYQAKISNC